MIVDEIIALIQQQSDEYEQTLWTIFYNIPEREYMAFKKKLVKANNGKKILAIKENDLIGLWDSFSLKHVIIE